MRSLVCKACLTSLCTVQYMVVKHSLRFKMMAMGLKLAGHKKVADMITSSWKVWHPSFSASLSHPHEALKHQSQFRLSMWLISCTGAAPGQDCSLLAGMSTSPGIYV